MPRREDDVIGQSVVTGVNLYVGGGMVNVIMQTDEGLVIFAHCEGTVDPVTILTGAGFAKGALVIKTDVGAGVGALYCNKGTETVAAFTLVNQA